MAVRLVTEVALGFQFPESRFDLTDSHFPPPLPLPFPLPPLLRPPKGCEHVLHSFNTIGETSFLRLPCEGRRGCGGGRVTV